MTAADRSTPRAPTLAAFELAGFWPATASLVVGAIVWEIASRWLNFAFMPSLGAVAHAAWRLTLNGEIPRNLGASAFVLVVGYALAASVGVIVGLLMGRYRSVAIACDPYLDALLAVPSLLLVPIFFGLFGLGRVTEIAVVFVYSFVVIAVMTRSALATVEPALIDMARVFGASEQQVVRYVLLPGALPTVMAGLRLGMGRAVRSLINAEMLLGPVGLGTLVRRYGSQFDAASVFGILTVLIGLALIANGAMRAVDRRINRWAD